MGYLPQLDLKHVVAVTESVREQLRRWGRVGTYLRPMHTRPCLPCKGRGMLRDGSDCGVCKGLGRLFLSKTEMRVEYRRLRYQAAEEHGCDPLTFDRAVAKSRISSSLDDGLRAARDYMETMSKGSRR